MIYSPGDSVMNYLEIRCDKCKRLGYDSRSLNRKIAIDKITGKGWTTNGDEHICRGCARTALKEQEMKKLVTTKSKKKTNKKSKKKNKKG